MSTQSGHKKFGFVVLLAVYSDCFSTSCEFLDPIIVSCFMLFMELIFIRLFKFFSLWPMLFAKMKRNNSNAATLNYVQFASWDSGRCFVSIIVYFCLYAESLTHKYLQVTSYLKHFLFLFSFLFLDCICSYCRFAYDHGGFLFLLFSFLNWFSFRFCDILFCGCPKFCVFAVCKSILHTMKISIDFLSFLLYVTILAVGSNFFCNGVVVHI